MVRTRRGRCSLEPPPVGLVELGEADGKVVVSVGRVGAVMMTLLVLLAPLVEGRLSDVTPFVCSASASASSSLLRAAAVLASIFGRGVSSAGVAAILSFGFASTPKRDSSPL